MQGSSPSSPAGPRLWRPAAQRNVRNTWSAINIQLATWAAASAEALSAATALVNAHLSQRYVASMDFGVLQAMDGIRIKAREKLFYQAEGFYEQLLRSYKDLVQCLSNMIRAKGSMRTYVKGSPKGPLIEFSDKQYLSEDIGDGDGITVFSTLSLSTHEMLAEELVTMFVSEIRIKWLIISELHCTLYSEVETGYLKEKFSERLLQDIYVETNLKVPGIFAGEHTGHGVADAFPKGSILPAKREVLQVFLTGWLAEVNIRRNRIEEILKIVSEEIQLNLSA